MKFGDVIEGSPQNEEQMYAMVFGLRSAGGTEFSILIADASDEKDIGGTLSAVMNFNGWHLIDEWSDE